MAVDAIEPDQPVYGTFSVRSIGGRNQVPPYAVEIRSLTDFQNSCTCPDYVVNGLGTCKHIEAVLARVRRRRPRGVKPRGSSRIEVYLSRVGAAPEVRIAWPKAPDPAARRLAARFFTSDGALRGGPDAAVPALARAVSAAPARLRRKFRIARDVEEWVADIRRGRDRAAAREAFLGEVRQKKRSLDFLKVPLYPYQEEGALHLAFNERALLADEMGLGKTVQAIAACELLHRTRGIERVLVVSPASLKAEWEEQIAKFTSRPARVVWGPRADRLRLYQEPSFFYLTNYEQIRSDVEDIVRLLAPDVVILDEAQRIKNWQTVTAHAVKRLSSPYAFILTGTPLENRIDEIYSIFQVLDPHVLGPLFRFNREFYDLDPRGRPQGYKNLDELHRRIRPLVLRRRKDEVEDQLPKRTVNNYFVRMAPEQQLRYDEYSTRAARILAILKRRPLTREEMEKLQKWLACMRMICDTPFILDPDCRISPKLAELGSVLEEVLQSPRTKVLIFSEWERMLELVKGVAERLGADFAWHTGSVPQRARRQEIRRFKDDPDCRLFLSTDSGSVGLNLQAANVVVNLDLPWNPAKLEQRIARAWRKHQARPVTVINLISSDSIEHRMLGLLSQKQQLADGVVDGRGDLRSLKMPSGRAAFMERLEALMGTEPAAKSPEPEPAILPRSVDPRQALRDDLVARLQERLLLLEVSGNGAGGASVLAVVDGPAAEVSAATIREALSRHLRADGRTPAVEILDRDTYEAVRRLVAGGLLKANPDAVRLHESPCLTGKAPDSGFRRTEALSVFREAERQLRMSALLTDGGFPVEALPSAQEAVRASIRALCHTVALEEAREPAFEPPLDLLQSRFASRGILSEETIGLVAKLRESAASNGNTPAEDARDLHASARRIHEQVRLALSEAAFLVPV